MNINYETFLPDIEILIDKQNHGALLNILIDLHPADIEEILNHLKKDYRKYLFDLLPTELASEVLVELDTPVADQILENKSDEEISDLLEEMDSDDAADVILELDDDIAERVLEKMDDEEADEVKQLLDHDEDTAGGIMALEYISMLHTASVTETIEEIRARHDDIEEIYNIWVVDKDNYLLGYVSLRDLVLAGPGDQLQKIMNPDVHFMKVGMDQEEVANYFKKYDLVSAPVLDEQMHMVGRITIDDIVDVLEEEGSEDLAYLSGAPDEEVLEESTFLVSRARIPWLMVSFFGTIFAAFILEAFNETIETFIASAFFFPLIMAMGGSVGQQASVIIVRGLATGDISIAETPKRLFKELKISMLIGTIFSLLIFLIIFVWQGALFAFVLGLSMFLVINGAALMGALIPLVFKRYNIDPALATAPFIATANDIFGLLIYLSIMTILLGLF